MSTMSQGRYAFLALLLGLLPMLMPLSVDGSVALMPAVATYFSAGIEPVQMSLSSLVLGVAVGQLVYGPLSDRYGRKPIILFGILCYSLFAAICSQAPNVESLIFLRFLQGFFACSGVIVARAVIRDLFDREAGARLFALIMGIHGIMPTIAPAVSGWMTEEFGWQSVFWAMSLFGMLTGLAILLGLSETNSQKNPKALNLKSMVCNFGEIINNRNFRSHAVCASFMYGALMAYYAGAPVCLIEYLGLTPKVVGMVMAVPMVFYCIAQITVARFVHVVGIQQLIRVGTCIGSLASAALLLFVLCGQINVYTLMGPIVVILVALAFVVPSTTAGAMSPFAKIAGAASSLLGFIQFLAAAGGMFLIAVLNDGTPLPMAGVIFVCAVGAFVSYFSFIRTLR